MEKYYLTTAIDYVNAAPHIGHAYEKIAADVVARYQRLAGREVYFLTGTDEHGVKIQNTAEAAGKSPQQFVDETAAKFIAAWKALNISNDYFIRTTEPRHEQAVQKIFAKMRDRGDIYKGKYIGLYCEGCEDYKRERDLIDGCCPNHKKPPVQMEEENYFFALTKYKDRLRQWLQTEGVVMPDGRRREVLNQLDDEDFRDFSVSRPKESLAWGIPVPGDEAHVIYVWIDALSNYITAIGYESDEQLFRRWWPANLHLIGKDIVKFHCIYWPAMLMSIDVELPKLVFSHGFITVEGQKMSKSLGNVLDPVWLVERYGADAVRYYLFAANSFDQDGDFSRAQLKQICNADLANNIGNLLNRTLAQVQKNCGGKVPHGNPNAASMQIAETALANYRSYMEKLEFAKAIEAARSAVDEANKYLNDQKPWTLFKEGKHEEAGLVLLTALELSRVAGIMLIPFTPKLAADIWNQLGFDGDIERLTFDSPEAAAHIRGGQEIRPLGPVFKRIEEDETAAVS